MIRLLLISCCLGMAIGQYPPSGVRAFSYDTPLSAYKHPSQQAVTLSKSALSQQRQKGVEETSADVPSAAPAETYGLAPEGEFEKDSYYGRSIHQLGTTNSIYNIQNSDEFSRSQPIEQLQQYGIPTRQIGVSKDFQVPAYYRKSVGPNVQTPVPTHYRSSLNALMNGQTPVRYIAIFQKHRAPGNLDVATSSFLSQDLQQNYYDEARKLQTGAANIGYPLVLPLTSNFHLGSPSGSKSSILISRDVGTSQNPRQLFYRQDADVVVTTQSDVQDTYGIPNIV